MSADRLVKIESLEDLQRAPEEILAVTAAQVRDFAAKRFTPAVLRTVIVSDLQQAGEALTKLDPGSLKVEASALKLEGPSLK